MALNNNVILEITKDGKIIWNEDAQRLIDNKTGGDMVNVLWDFEKRISKLELNTTPESF